MPHLDIASWYSFHHGVASPEELCYEAAALGFDTLGIADRDGTYGLISFYKAAIKYGLRPVLGLALTAPPRPEGRPGPEALRHGPDARQPDNAPQDSMGSLRLRDKTWHNAAAQRGCVPGSDEPLAVLLAKNREGYSELCALASARQLDAHFNAARAIAAGSANCYVISDNESLLAYLAPRLGPQRLFVRVSPDHGPAWRALQLRQLKLAQRLRLRPLAMSEVCFVKPQDQALHHALRAIGQNTGFAQAAGVRSRAHYLAAPTELPGFWYDCPEALDNARALAARCDVEFILGRWHFPNFDLPGGRPPAQLLAELCDVGYSRRLGERATEAHRARLEMELNVIEDLGYSSYFLFVYEIVREAFRRGIPFLGRGSAANSIVSFLLGLTPIDPLRYNMYFERFLNAERKSPPDIDIDFNWRRRDEIIQFVYDRWGHERVAMISTHQSFRARGALRELAKVYGLSDAEISRVNRYLPQMHASKLAGHAARLPEMQDVDLSAEPYRELLPLAARLAGRPRHLGIHCGGIVIAPDKLTNYTGLQRAAKGFVVTQYDMFPIEDIGLIKIDLLGNRSLGVLEDTMASLKSRGISPPVNSMEVLTRDRRVRQMLRSGNTFGCFYIESPAMRSLLARLRTETYLGLTAASSVIRPGVAESGMMQEYIRRVNGMERKLPSHPLMEQLLPETHGVMVYQEDVIRVAHELAGLSATQSDILRRGMSGKHRSPDEMNRLREVFISGCEKKGVESASALEIWRQLSSFSGYSFCKAHSASFATLSYQVAFLKAYYPAEFMAAVLSNGGGFYGPRAYVSECERLGLHIAMPDVNHSFAGFSAESRHPSGRNDTIRIGLSMIKGLAVALIERIVSEREARGRYRSLPELRQRLRVHPAELELLILAGALDSLGLPRPQLLWLAQAGQQKGAAQRAGQGSAAIFSADEEWRSYGEGFASGCEDYDANKLAELEWRCYGVLFSRHPLTDYAALIERGGFVPASELTAHAGRRVRMLGWCVATKRVDMGGRRQVRDSLELQAADYDAPDEEASFGPQVEARENAGHELGLVMSYPAQHGARDYGSAPSAMKFMSMEDLSGTFEVTLFPDAYNRFAPLTRQPGPFIVDGVVDEQFGICSLTASRLQLADDYLRRIELGRLQEQPDAGTGRARASVARADAADADAAVKGWLEDSR